MPEFILMLLDLPRTYREIKEQWGVRGVYLAFLGGPLVVISIIIVAIVLVVLLV